MRLYTSTIIIILIALVAVPVFASGKSETIVFWYGATPDERAAYEQMISEFEKFNPDIKVKAMLVPQSYVERKLILSVAGGVPPDVVRFYAHLGGEMMSRGGLEPLDPMIEKDSFDLSDFYKVGIEQNTYRGKLYGIPWVLSPNAFFYNVDIYKKAGITRPPVTWNELRSASLKVTRRGQDDKLERVGFADFLYNPNNFSLYLWQSGGELLSEDGRSVRFDSPEGVEALKWMKSFLDQEAGGVQQLQTFSANFKGAVQDPFGQGLLASRIDSPFRIPDLKRYFPNTRFAVGTIPYNREPACEVVGNSLVIPRGSKHKEAAWKFIKFASSPEQIAQICKVAGRIPARQSVATSPKFYSDPVARGFIDQIPYGRSVPVVPGWREAGDALAREIEMALKGQKSPEEALNDAASRANEVLARANEDMTKLPVVPWRFLGIAAAGALVLGIIAATIYILRNTRASKRDRREAGQFYLFAAPWLIGFTVFTFGSMATSLVMSFSKWDTLSVARFVGIRNYIDLFSADKLFYKSISVTAYYAIFSVPLAILGGLAVSVLLNQKLFGIRIFRTIYYLPVVISGVATSVLWFWIFNPTNGLVNNFLRLKIIPGFSNGFVLQPAISNPPGWFLDPAWALPAFIIMGLWSIGGSMVIYLAALQGVPEELYEAAKIDGAGPFKTFISVTLPLLTPAIFYQLVTGTLFSLQMFTQPYIMTNGGPQDSTLFYALYLFRNAFEWMKMGYGSAMAWILFIVVLVITLINVHGSKRWVYYEGGDQGK